jgi:hypothetical protein
MFSSEGGTKQLARDKAKSTFDSPNDAKPSKKLESERRKSEVKM